VSYFHITVKILIAFEQAISVQIRRPTNAHT